MVVLGVGSSAALAGLPADALAAVHPHVQLSAEGPARVAPGGIVLVQGRLSGPRGISAQLLARGHRGWRRVASPRLLGSGNFMFRLRAPGRGGSIALRVTVARGRRTLARRDLHVIAVRRGAPTTAGPHTSASVISAGSVAAIPPAGSPGSVVLAGHQTLTPGTILAVPAGQRTPNGFLGRVQSVVHVGNQTVVQTGPATLEQAVPAGSFDLDHTVRLARDGHRAADERHASRRAGAAAGGHEGAFNQDLSKALSCEGGVSLEAHGQVGLSSTPKLLLSWSPFHGVSASFTETVRASASLGGSLSRGASCTFKRTALLAHPAELGTFEGDVLGVPVVVTLRGQVYLDGKAEAQSSVSAGVSGSISASGGIAFSHGRASVISPAASLSLGVQGPSAQASASLGAHVTPELQVLLYGLGGPVFDATTGLDFSADTTQNPWWTLTSPLTVTASLQIPDFDISTPSLTLYSHTFHIAQASGPFGGGPLIPKPPPPTVQVPASGPTLVDQENTAADSSNGDQTFSNWSTATGQAADVVSALPASLSGYRCVVLDLNQSLAPGDQSQLGGFLAAGGTVVALGEHSDGGGFDAADTTLNQLASALGTGLALTDDSNDGSDTVSTNIGSSPLTEGVTSLGYNWASSLSLTGAAQPLVQSSDGTYTLLGASSVGRGTFVMSGDSNALSDNSSGFFQSDGNGRLAANLCP